MTTTTKHRKGGSKGGNQYGSYTVRNASEKQIAFIKKLLDQKKHNNLSIDFTKLNVQGATELIKTLMALENNDTHFVLPTEKQLSYAKLLIRTKVNGFALEREVLDKNGVTSLANLSSTEVSKVINTLKPADYLPQQITETGAYRFNGRVVSVRIGNQSGKWQVWEYNKELGKWGYDFKKTWILAHLTPAMRLSLEEAIKISAQTGTCVHCGRTLTDLKSVAGGMGKVCADKYGYRN